MVKGIIHDVSKINTETYVSNMFAQINSECSLVHICLETAELTYIGGVFSFSFPFSSGLLRTFICPMSLQRDIILQYLILECFFDKVST